MSQRAWSNAVTHLWCRCASTKTSASCCTQLRCCSLQCPLPDFDTDTTPAEYAERRQRFLQHYLPPHSVAILPAADDFVYSHDITSPHRQDSLWYHLFGFYTPLRRQLDPPSLTLTEEVRATMAVFARGCDNTTHTLLCVPPPTTNPAVVVWAAETVSLSAYEEVLCAAPPQPRTGEAAGTSTSTSTSAVITNNVDGIYEAVCKLISQMAERQLASLAVKSRGGVARASQTLTVDERLTRDQGDLLRIMPHLFAAYPAQLRWDGRRYRLPRRNSYSPPQSQGALDVPTRSATATRAFHHPLEAFFHALDSTAFMVQLPRRFFDATSQSPWDAAVFHYNTATAYTPGLVFAPPQTTNSTSTSDERRILIATPAPDRRAATSHSHPNCGDVRLPIRRIDAHAWSYRLLKSPSQVRQHLRSARATEHAFLDLMRHAATTVSEHELHCVFQRSVCECSAHFGPGGRVRAAYVPVIASGVRGIDIHYTDNCGSAVAGRDVVRVDTGVEVALVPTDCTRTFPVGSVRFPSPPLEQLYDGLIRIQQALLRRIAPGVAVCDVATLHLDETRALLCSLGVDVRRGTAAKLDAPPSSSAKAPRASTEKTAGGEEDERQLPMALVRSCFCAHSFGHLFGIDIHEEWGTSAATPHVFQGGMMHTVEPGIYMPSLARARLFGLTAAQLPRAFHDGVGVQVEDDVLILPPAAYTNNSTEQRSTSATAAQHTSAHAPPGSWNRGVYLQHALAAFARYYNSASVRSGAVSSTSSLDLPSAVVRLCQENVQALLRADIIAAVAAHEWNVVCFMFAQRLAVDGYESAVAALSADVVTARKLMFTTCPAYGSQMPFLVPDAAHAEWYPYSIVVLTASIPKDRRWMESLMSQGTARHSCGVCAA
jgi:Xaa-Pro aminopeptidase